MLTRLTKDFGLGDKLYRIDISVRRQEGDIFIDIFDVGKFDPRTVYMMITKLRISGAWHIQILKSKKNVGSLITYKCESYLEMKERVIKMLIYGEN